MSELCKKDPCEKCLCLKRKHGDCADCEKKAIKIVQKSGKDLNELIKDVKESGETIHDLYVGVDGFDLGLEWHPPFTFRSAIDILRGVCNYCKRRYTKICHECMWLTGLNDKDFWCFDDQRDA